MRVAFVLALVLCACVPSDKPGGEVDMGPPPLPQRAVCGNGVVEGDEACDDANADPSDGCTNDCALAACGDGILRTDLALGADGWEQCDDGNVLDGDACRTDCRAPECGDGVLDEGERCDDGNLDDSDDCRSDCRRARCGDEILNGDEACDDSNGVDTDACTNDCTEARCGDGIVWEGVEVCDGGAGCREDCTMPACGDGRPDEGEECDDGDDDDTDACTAMCRDAFCGDGLVQAGVEQCDGADGCRLDCTTPACGDAIEDPGEDCDDGNDADDDDCTTACEDAVCGDGFVRVDIPFGEPGWEGCDAPDDPQRCDDACVPLRCGDGELDPEEGCDDGNDADDDACTNACAEAACGDGVLRADLEPGEEGYEACDDGNDRDEDDCLADCTEAACGDGIVNANAEDCDDGNRRAGDGCDEACRSEAPVAVIERPLDPAWASVFANFHPQSACFDRPTGHVALMIQSRREIVLVDPATGVRAGQVAVGNYSHTTGVACDGDDFYFTDYSGNAGGPDLFRTARAGGAAVQISQGVAAYGGFPLAIDGDTLWRANDSRRYDWTDLTAIRVSTKAAPDNVQREFDVAVPEGIGDLCHDGTHLWVLGNVRQEAPLPAASLFRVDPENGDVLDTYRGFYDCQNGRPAGLACDGASGRGWLFCFNENRNAPGGLVELRLPVAAACPDCECGNGEVERGEACDDGNLEADDGCSPACRLEGRDAPPELVRETALPAAWAGVRANFHPQGACYDARSGAVVLAIQSRRRLDFVDPATGALDGGVALPDYQHVVSVGCGGDGFLFSDYTRNAGGPDLLGVGRGGGAVVQLSAETNAFGGYPLTVAGDTLWRGVATPGYDWRAMRTIRVASRANPDVIERQFQVPAPGGVGDLCFDGVSLWVLGYVHEGAGADPNADLYRVDPTTGVLEAAFEDHYRCRTGRPAGLACDAAGARGWVFCFDEGHGDGTLAEFAMGGCADEDCEVCGDGELDPGEACDGGDDCRPDCTLIRCGDGIVDDGEACDGGDDCRPDCTEIRCGDGIVDDGEACDDGNDDDDDGCSAACEEEEDPVEPGAPRLVREVRLDAEWAGVHQNFHPQGACYDAFSTRVVLMIQSRRRLDFVDPATGLLDGGLELGDDYTHGTGVGCGDPFFYFTDYSGNAGGPDLFRIVRANAVEQISARNDAFGGFPLTVHDGTMWRGTDSAGYDWSPIQAVRVSTVAEPDRIQAQLAVDVPSGIGDLCHDGTHLWALGYVHEDDPDPTPEADLYRLDPETGARRAFYDDVYRCSRGRPAGLACDGDAERLWIFCFDEAHGDGTLAELTLGDDAPPEPVCGNGAEEAGEGCDDGNRADGDGCSAECEVEVAVGGAPRFVSAIDLDAAWSGVHQNFHPQGICYDAVSGHLAFAIQSRRRIDFVETTTGALEGGVQLPGQFSHVTGVACDADLFYFTDYSGNRGGPDLFSVTRQGATEQISRAVAAYGGFPLTVSGDRMWRTNDSDAYDWSDLDTLRLTNKATPDVLVDSFAVAVPGGVGDLCHDGESVWALAYSHERGGVADASVYVLDPETGARRRAHEAFYRCPRGRPAGWACDGEAGRAWLFCYAERDRGVLVEFRLPGAVVDDGDLELNLEREVPLAPEWASVQNNFHPQSACYDDVTGRVALSIQSRQRVELVDPATGQNDRFIPTNLNHMTGIACDAGGFFFADYTANRNGPDLHFVARAGDVAQVADEREAFGGYPLTVHGKPCGVRR